MNFKQRSLSVFTGLRHWHVFKHLNVKLQSTMIEPLITINDGRLRGKIAVDERGRNYYSFQGIPYAKPPIGSLRFKAPQPVEKWSHELDATKQNRGCYARNFFGDGFVGTEDCLILNVYTPAILDNKPKPVMFWIHGGGFTSGSSKTDFYGPEYLMPEDVVLVTINYRLGALGFLKMEDPSLEVTGNSGLKDMVMALKWVQQNIKEFGGDPDNVTIFGESAGGAAVHYLMLSPLAKGLFHKAIAQSGCALNPWARGDPLSTQKLSKALGIQENNEKHILEALQSMSVRELFTNGVMKLKDNFSPGHLRPFCPVIEKKTDDFNFITDDPINIIQSGNYNKVPLMMGCTSREGMLLHRMIPKKHALTDITLVPQNLNLDTDTNVYKEVAEKIKLFYFRGPTSNADIHSIFKLYTDNYFLAGVYKSAKYHQANLEFPLYFYRFSLDTEMNVAKKLFSLSEPGACHIDDLAYLFKNIASPEIAPMSREDVGVRRMTKLWTNFAKNGNPTSEINDLIPVKWQPVAKDKFNFLDIGENLKMDVDVEKEAMKFWESLENITKIQSKL